MSRFTDDIHNLLYIEIERQVGKRTHKLKAAQKTAADALAASLDKYRDLENSHDEEHDRRMKLEERIGTADAALARAAITIRSLQDRVLASQKEKT